MNNTPSTTIIYWETRSRKASNLAELYCMNYGLKIVSKRLYIGQLYSKEQKELCFLFKSVFTRKTDKFVSAILCKNCTNNLDANSWNLPEDASNFEIITLE